MLKKKIIKKVKIMLEENLQAGKKCMELENSEIYGIHLEDEEEKEKLFYQDIQSDCFNSLRVIVNTKGHWEGFEELREIKLLFKEQDCLDLWESIVHEKLFNQFNQWEKTFIEKKHITENLHQGNPKRKKQNLL